MIRRRALLAAASCLWACKNDPPAEGARPSTHQATWKDLPFAPSATYREKEHALLLVQREAPIVVALHGRGEAHRGLVRGARGFRDDYDLDRVHARALAAPLRADDFLGMVEPARLAAWNAALKKEPFRGLAVACPFAPDVRDRSATGAAPFAGFVVDTLLPRVRRELGAAADRARTGIDGVSMGGRLALHLGFRHPEVFGAVGALQPAIGVGQVESIAAAAKAARDKAPQHVRLVSSEEDPFLPAVRALSAALGRVKVPHQLVVCPGPHDYIWNRGPGSFEMILWHERVLRGLTAP